MPFSRAEFFEVFARYNETVWPAQILLYGLAIGAVLFARSKSARAGRVVFALLAILWLWMGVVYHAVFFAAINPLARVFSAFFIIQAVIFGWLAFRRQAISFAGHDSSARIGVFLIGFALIGYPLFAVVAGHSYPAQPTFGLPCPTTIFTLGMLLLASHDLPRRVFVIPFGWAIAGTSGAFALGVPEDLSLPFALVATLIALWSRVPKLRRLRHA